MSTFVEIPSDAMLKELREIGSAIVARGGKCEEGRAGREVVFDFSLPKMHATEPVQVGHHGATVRVYTSMAVGSVTARDVGRDAVRIVVGANVKGKFHVIEKFKRIHRTAPKGPHEMRVRAFLERLRQTLRDAYAIARKVPACPKCAGPMAVRKNKKSGSEFYGCMNYPECRGTRPKGDSK